MERMKDLINQMNLKETCDMDSFSELQQKRIDAINKQKGKLNITDGLDCPLCLNRGYSYVLEKGNPQMVICKCIKQREVLNKAKQMGLDVNQTFDNFETPNPWQKAVIKRAKEFVENPQSWFFVGGISGSGKTHICTAICNELIKKYELYFFAWRDEGTYLKSHVIDDEYDARIRRIIDIDVLYIDDLFKGKITDADVNLAYQIINGRYIKKLPTIISTEHTIDKLKDIDSAIAGRIYEMTRKSPIVLQQVENWRFK